MGGCKLQLQLSKGRINNKDTVAGTGVRADVFSFGPKNFSFSNLNHFPFNPNKAGLLDAGPKETKIREDNFYWITL